MKNDELGFNPILTLKANTCYTFLTVVLKMTPPNMN